MSRKGTSGRRWFSFATTDAAVFSEKNLWVLNGQELSRYEDNGVQLVRNLAPYVFASPLMTSLLFANDDDVWLLNDYDKPIRMHLDRTTLSVTHHSLPSIFGDRSKSTNALNYVPARPIVASRSMSGRGRAPNRRSRSRPGPCLSVTPHRLTL